LSRIGVGSLTRAVGLAQRGYRQQLRQVRDPVRGVFAQFALQHRPCPDRVRPGRPQLCGTPEHEVVVGVRDVGVFLVGAGEQRPVPVVTGSTVVLTRHPSSVPRNKVIYDPT